LPPTSPLFLEPLFRKCLPLNPCRIAPSPRSGVYFLTLPSFPLPPLRFFSEVVRVKLNIGPPLFMIFGSFFTPEDMFLLCPFPRVSGVSNIQTICVAPWVFLECLDSSVDWGSQESFLDLSDRLLITSGHSLSFLPLLSPPFQPLPRFFPMTPR